MSAVRRAVAIASTAVLVWGLVSCGGSGDDDDAVSDPDPAAGDGDAADRAPGDGADMPDELPSDFYLPAGITRGFATSSDEFISYSGTLESGTIEEIEADMIAGLTAAGYELLSNEDFPVFAKNGVGRVRVRASELFDELTLNVDIDRWSDDQLDQLRNLTAEPVVVPGEAVATVDGVTYTATGECTLRANDRTFSSDDGSITVQTLENEEPHRVYGDVTTPDGGQVYTTDIDADLEYSASDDEIEVSGEMTDYLDPDGGAVAFTVTATCG